MGQIITFLLLSFLILTQSDARPRSKARAFIEFQCQTTLYPNLCVTCLSPYATNFTTPLSHRQLAHTALQVSLARAESTRAYVTGVANRTTDQDVSECLNQINDGVDLLANCIKEAQEIKEDGASSDFTWHASNVQTWMSTAVTDASRCVDGLSGGAIGGKTKAMIKARVVNLQQVTSNALALFNRFAARYRTSKVKKVT